ncbi:hypothetical protein [Pedobacter sp. SYSU D00535]|uniref:hypothetical protein n=1 Tax=Pedobacter sp. SYSU D00535 TaxID=2810308 RepID=UPI001A97A221|nr:hypothetical protein [Pedobacter sp. SYSU D00535]
MFLLKDICLQESNPTLLIGNGVNKFNARSDVLSWDGLLERLWQKVSNQPPIRPAGISLTEYYDILELENDEKINFQKEVASILSTWSPSSQHFRIVEYARLHNLPILTTNFDDCLEKATVGGKFQKLDGPVFTDFYPWQTYFSDKVLDSPLNGFSIWHINGMILYSRSIRLGLGHYMGSVEKARLLIHAGNEESLFSGKNQENWKGRNSWLHIIFNCTLIIFGLQLEENETFLRWLLLQRMQYFRQFPERKYEGYYINVLENGEMNSGKRLFLERVGFKIIDLQGYKDLYEGIWR